MPKAAPIQFDFTGGEISPYAQGQVGMPWYKKSMGTCFNGLPMIQGPWTRRPGTKYIDELVGSSNRRLIPFAPKYGSNCMMVMDTSRVRCYQNYALVATVNFSTSTVYDNAEIPQVRFVQNGNYIYLFHTNHPPIYLGDTLGNGYPNVKGLLNFYDGPYGNSNVDANGFAATATTFTLSGGVGPGATITASATTGINGGAGFQSTDLRRFIRLNPAATAPGTGTWCWFQITAVTDSTHVTGILFNAPGSTTATVFWTMGLFTSAPGCQPGCGTIYGGRLYLGGSLAFPRRFDASSLEYDISLDPINIHFNPTQYPNGVVTDASGLSFTLASRDSQNTCWMEGDERGVLMGTTGDEWTIRPDSLSGAISPTNVDAKASTFFGSNPNVAPCKVGKSIIFVQRSSLKIRELFYAFDIGGYRAPDRTRWAEHITGSGGIVEMAHQREPQSIMWAVRADGTLCALTHQEEDGEITAGWHRHALGVNPDSGSGAGTCSVITIGVLPSFDKTRDEVWVVTNRKFSTGGSVIQCIEVMQPVANQFVSDADQWYFDFGTQVVNGSPTATITGLSVYEGMVVSAWADGAYFGTFTVASGQIVLPQAVTKCLVGFDYISQGQLNRIEAGAADGTALGKIRRTHRVGLVLQQTSGMSIGMSFANLTALQFRTQSTGLGVAQPSFSGIRVEEVDADYDTENQFCWQANNGNPCTVLAVCPRMDTQDAG